MVAKQRFCFFTSGAEKEAPIGKSLLAIFRFTRVSIVTMTWAILPPSEQTYFLDRSARQISLERLLRLEDKLSAQD